MHSVIKSIERLQRVFIYVSALFMALLSFMVFYEVISRYVFSSPTIWANELSTYLLQFIVFFSMGYLVIKDDHLKVTFFLDKVKGRALKALKIFNNLLIIPYAVILLIYGWNVTATTFERDATSPTLLAVPLWIPNSFIFLGGALLILGCFCSILKIIFEDPAEGEEEGGGIYD